MVEPSSPKHLAPVRAHFDRLLADGLDVYGPERTPMWMASLDTRTGRYPEDDTRPESIGKRVYRNIDAPRGCSLYWDQPALVAAHALSAATGEPRYAEAADAYVRSFLERCVAQNGVFLWGNHYYYDAFLDMPVRFHGEEAPTPCDLATETGELHEIRPITPAWEIFWQVSPQATERGLRAALAGHLVDAETGKFNRHADGRTGCAFLEAGGVLIQSLAWLYGKTGDDDLLGAARRIADFSFRYRHPATGLLENCPTVTRWDKHASTTEVGLWAGCLLRAAEGTGIDEWVEMADASVSAWLRYGYDESTGRFYGRLRVADGSPILGPKETPYQPGDYGDLWEPLFPTHDYPMPFAECCLALYKATGREEYATACRRWAEAVRNELPARGGVGAYAEHYGRCIHFLLGCAEALGDGESSRLAEQVADEALDTLWAHGLFRGHPGEDRYDAVDGVGFLALALIQLATGDAIDLMGTGW